ncbi:unnamed protein product [Linum trigynum]|uniref:Uncharacterized protein n=1 Tax=Linum trigynum TaxID=586398 RepID=A0AAV2E349_9ROSI
MALTASAITGPKSLCRAQTPLSISKPTCSCSCFSSSQPQFDRNAYCKPSLNSVPKRKNRLVDVGIELLSASILALSPMDADATRIIEYYATVGEPLCEFSFVRSGLGYTVMSLKVPVKRRRMPS